MNDVGGVDKENADEGRRGTGTNGVEICVVPPIDCKV